MLLVSSARDSILYFRARRGRLVGTVHKTSATGGFVRKLGLGNAATCSGPEEVADWLMSLAHPGKCAEQSARSRDAFAYVERQEAPAQKLKSTMEKIG